MTRRTRLIIAGVAVALVALGLAAYLTLRPAPAENAPAAAPIPTQPLTPSGVQPATNAPATAVTTATPPPAPTFARASERDILTRQLTATGAQFTERFGTYSNQGDFQNLYDLFPLMTTRMQQTVQRTIDAAGTAPTTGYVGVTTRAVTTRLASLDEAAGRAAVEVSAQRATQTGDAAPTTRYQTLTLEFRKMQNVWKVDSAAWSAP